MGGSGSRSKSAAKAAQAKDLKENTKAQNLSSNLQPQAQLQQQQPSPTTKLKVRKVPNSKSTSPPNQKIKKPKPVINYPPIVIKRRPKPLTNSPPNAKNKKPTSLSSSTPLKSKETLSKPQKISSSFQKTESSTVDRTNLSYTEFKKLKDDIMKLKQSRSPQNHLNRAERDIRKQEILAILRHSAADTLAESSMSSTTNLKSKISQKLSDRKRPFVASVRLAASPKIKTVSNSQSTRSLNQTPERQPRSNSPHNFLKKHSGTKDSVLKPSKSLTLENERAPATKAASKIPYKSMAVEDDPEKTKETHAKAVKHSNTDTLPKIQKQPMRRAVSITKINNTPRIEKVRRNSLQKSPSHENTKPVNYHDLEQERNQLILSNKYIHVVKNVPSAMLEEPKKLAKYLSKHTATELEKAWIVFMWIAHNIKYEPGASAPKEKIVKNQDPAVVLSRKQAVSTGYCYLLKELVGCLGFTCTIIQGFARVFSLPSEKKESSLSEHEWVAIQISSRWYLIDPTWAAGYIDSERGNFVFDFEPFWFMTPPHEFIYSHLPKDAKWQFLEGKPIDEKTFLSLLFVNPVFFRYSISIFDDQKTNSASNEPELIKVVSKDGSNFLTVESGVLQIKIKCPVENDIKVYVVPNDGRKKYEGFIQKEKNHCLLTASFQKTGIHTIEVFARRFCERGGFKQAIKFNVNAVRVASKGYYQTPIKFDEFDGNRCYLYQPLFVSFAEGDKVKFKLKISNPAVTVVAVKGKFDEDWRALDKSENESGVWEKELIIEGMPLQVGIKKNGSKGVKSILEYESITS